MTRTPSRRPIIQLVTDRNRYASSSDPTGVGEVVDVARRAAAAGVDLIQVRERGLGDRDLLRLVAEIRAAVRQTAARVLVNSRTDIALAAGVHGVHLPAAAPLASRVRRIAPGDFLIGRSVHSQAEAEAAQADGGCDYLTFGTVFATASKPTDHPVAGLSTLRAVCDAVRLPILAIGGISPERMPDIARAGAAGMAAIGLFADISVNGEGMRLLVNGLRADYDSGRRG